VGGLSADPAIAGGVGPSVNYPTFTVTAQSPGTDHRTWHPPCLASRQSVSPCLNQNGRVKRRRYVKVTLQFDLSRPSLGRLRPLSAINAAAGLLPKNMRIRRDPQK